MIDEPIKVRLPIEVRLAVIEVELKQLIKQTDAICKKLDAKYVTKEEFNPIKKLVYGTVTIILLAVITAIVMTVIK